MDFARPGDVSKEGTREIYVTVTLTIRKDANANGVIEDMDYDFRHEDIIDTEISSWNGF